jgi:hypothetical protein
MQRLLPLLLIGGILLLAYGLIGFFQYNSESERLGPLRSDYLMSCNAGLSTCTDEVNALFPYPDGLFPLALGVVGFLLLIGFIGISYFTKNKANFQSGGRIVENSPSFDSYSTTHPQVVSSSSETKLEEELKKLADMKSKGLIDDEEYKALKQKLLDGVK